MNDNNQRIISHISKKWKLEQVPNKKLELENKLMEERLNQLKAELKSEKKKRTGPIWSKGETGLVTTYAKNVHNPDSINNKDSVLNKPSNRAIKLKILKDEAIASKQDTKANSKDKKQKCGQCEKNTAFTRCLECCEDYCANCFTDFHMKGALQKHRTVAIPILPTSGKNMPRPPYQDARTDYQNKNQYETTHDSNFSMFDNDDAEFMNNQQDNDDMMGYEDTTKPPIQGSLLYGAYDEKEAGESFQQALNEWRNPKPKSDNKTPLQSQRKKVNVVTPRAESKDVIIGTDSRMKTGNQFKQLEDHIKSNHSLSCAERMLLAKLKREDKENRDGSGLSDRSDTKNYLIEEVPQAQKFPKTSINLKNLEPDLIEIPKSNKIDDLSSAYTRPNSIAPNNRPQSSVSRPGTSRSRPSTARPTTSRPGTARRSVNPLMLETNICRVASAKLKDITNRESTLEKIYNEDNSIGEFLLIDVTKKQEENTGSTTDRQKEPFKLSHKFLEMCPRSWQPMNSINSEAIKATDEDEDKTPRAMNTPTLPETTRKNSRPNNTPVPLSSRATPTNMIAKNRKESASSQSLSKNIKSVNFDKKNNLSKSLARNKTFINPAQLSKTTPRSARVKSAAGSFASQSNQFNLEVAQSFLEFDIDDGRSSKLCQNEDDSEYYSQLEVEYKKVHRTADFSIPEISNKIPKAEFKVLPEDLIKNSMELNLKDEDFDNDDFDFDLDIEELKSLR